MARSFTNRRIREVSCLINARNLLSAAQEYYSQLGIGGALKVSSTIFKMKVQLREYTSSPCQGSHIRYLRIIEKEFVLKLFRILSIFFHLFGLCFYAKSNSIFL